MKVIFNYLPPGNIDYPSPSMSILQSFLKHKGFEASTIYWNILMFQIMSYYTHTNDIIRNLFPFLAVIADEADDRALKNRMRSYLQTMQPYYKTKDDFYSNSLKEICNSVHQIIDDNLKNDNNETILFGISAKFFQWLPGVVLSKEIKKKYPHSKIVIGGLESRDSAIAIMQKFNDFDYVIWGEGEYPLLDLCNHLQNNSVNLVDIPRFVFRKNTTIIASKINKSEYLDFKNYIFPDNDDYFECLSANSISKDIVKIMINSVNGCRWNKCSFCSYMQNKGYRARTAENIFEEIKLCSDKYGINHYYMADNDIVGKDIERFKQLLNLLTQYKKNENSDFRIYGELIPTSMINPEVISKMSSAGFSSIYIGYESVSDSLLKKMNKENTFSDNILFVKSALKFKIRPQVYIIQGIPTETEEDIIESINNLHFLRFYLNEESGEFLHNYSPLNLYKGTRYFSKMTRDEKDNYDQNPVTNYIPRSIIGDNERFDFFSFRRNVLKNQQLWSDFVAIERYYRKSKFTYNILINDQSFTYSEFLNGKEIKSNKYNAPVYLEILKEAESKVVSFNYMLHTLSEKYSDLTADKLKEYLNELKTSYMIYHDDKFSSIISIIHLSSE